MFTTERLVEYSGRVVRPLNCGFENAPSLRFLQTLRFSGSPTPLFRALWNLNPHPLKVAKSGAPGTLIV